MKIEDKDVRYVAALANLELTEEERARMVRDLNSILGYIDQLNELDTSNVEPMAQSSSRVNTAATSPMREDCVTACLSREEALKNAPETDGAFFKVPKVIEK